MRVAHYTCGNKSFISMATSCFNKDEYAVCHHNRAKQQGNYMSRAIHDGLIASGKDLIASGNFACLDIVYLLARRIQLAVTLHKRAHNPPEREHAHASTHCACKTCIPHVRPGLETA